IAGAVAAAGQLQQAVRLLGGSEAALERVGAFRQPSDTPEIDSIDAELRARLSAAPFQKARDRVRRETLALGVDSAPQQPTAISAHTVKHRLKQALKNCYTSGRKVVIL